MFRTNLPKASGKNGDVIFLLTISLGMAKEENCHILENPAYPLLSKNGDVIIGAVFSIHSGTQIQSLQYTAKPQPLICIRFVVVDSTFFATHFV